MKLGFTGSRRGMTPAQERAVGRALQKFRPTEVHYGCCVGADDEFYAIARLCSTLIVGHPSNIEKMTVRRDCYQLFPPMPPLERNTDIVVASDVIIGCPYEYVVTLRGGTWHTLREAVRLKKEFYIIVPSGEIYNSFLNLNAQQRVDV